MIYFSSKSLECDRFLMNEKNCDYALQIQICSKYFFSNLHTFTNVHTPFSVQNSPWLSTNAEAFLHSIVLASTIKMLRQLDS